MRREDKLTSGSQGDGRGRQADSGTLHDALFLDRTRRAQTWLTGGHTAPGLHILYRKQGYVSEIN